MYKKCHGTQFTYGGLWQYKQTVVMPSKFLLSYNSLVVLAKFYNSLVVLVVSRVPGFLGWAAHSREPGTLAILVCIHNWELSIYLVVGMRSWELPIPNRSIGHMTFKTFAGSCSNEMVGRFM